MHGFNYLFYLAYHLSACFPLLLFIVALVLPLPLPLIGILCTTGLVPGGLAVDPVGGRSLPRPWCDGCGTCACPPQPSVFVGAGLSAGTLSGVRPVVPTWLVASGAGSPQAGDSSSSSVLASASEVQPLGVGANTLASTAPQQLGAMATQTVAAGVAPPLPTAKEIPTLVLPISGLLGIPGPLVAKIKEGKFIDLGDLLPEALEWAFERSTEERKEEGKKKRFPVTSIADWTLSFATFMAVAVHFAPQRAVPLAMYMAIVARLAREVPGDCWLRYDRTFHQAAAVNPALPWDRREPDVWLAAMVERSAPGSGGMAAAPRAQPPRPQFQRPPPSGPKVCWRYQSGVCYGTCKFLHVCSRCMAPDHVVKDCPKRPAP